MDERRKANVVSEAWMKNNVVGDVQTAIQSQTIQTAIEKNTSVLTDQSFQSFLTNAPLPRIYMEAQGAGQVINNAALTDLIWGQAARKHDPYFMHPAATTTTIQVPIDGYYSFYCNTNFASAAAATVWQTQFQFVTVLSKIHGAAVVLDVVTLASPIFAGALQWAFNLAMNKPLAAGDTFKIQIFQSSGAAITLGSSGFITSFGGTWSAPYNNYTVGG